VQAPGDEDERVRRRAVEPLGIVDEAQDRALVARLGQQAQQTERHEEAVVDPVEAEAERAAQGGRLRRGQPVDERELRPDELVHPGERQLVLGLDPRAAHHAHPVAGVLGVREQRRLADARLAADDERGAAAVPRALEEGVDRALLGLAAHEHGPIVCALEHPLCELAQRAASE
jgi:hypothetical protein